HHLLPTPALFPYTTLFRSIPWLFQPLLRKKVSLAKSRDSVLDRGSVSDSQRSDQNGAGLKTCPGGYDAPGDHDPGNPHARPEFLQEHIAGNFEKEISDKENASAVCKSRIA